MKQVERMESGEDLKGGVPELDQDHRRFLSMVDDLESALTSRSDKMEIRRLMTLIIDDAVQHFEHEERLFLQSGYPDAALHAGMHARLVGDLMTARTRLDGADVNADWIAIAFTIRYLLMDHLLEYDMKYRDFMRDALQDSC